MRTVLRQVFFYLLIALSLENSFSQEDQEYAKVIVHNIGQGNFITLEIKQKRAISSKEESKSEQEETSISGNADNTFIIVDCGSSSYKKELAYMATKKGQETSDEEKSMDILASNLLKKRLKIFNSINRKTPVHVKALIFTHPDNDHINRIQQFLNHPDDKVEYIICGGLPELYQKEKPPKKTASFKKWLKQQVGKGSKIYFPVLSYEAITDKHTLKAMFAQTDIDKTRWAPPHFTPENYDSSESYKAHPFPDLVRELAAINDDFKLYFLAVNPLHEQASEEGKPEVEESEKGKEKDEQESTRESQATDIKQKRHESNQDSLVIKAAYAGYSIVLIGDATKRVDAHILRNYRDATSILSATGYVAEHHGASTEGSNDAEILRHYYDPEFVFISHGSGTRHGHPTQQTVQTVASLPNLQEEVAEHTLTIGRAQREKQTSKAVFSTLEDDDLTAVFYKDRYELSTGLKGKVYPSTQSSEIEKAEAVKRKRQEAESPEEEVQDLEQEEEREEKEQRHVKAGSSTDQEPTSPLHKKDRKDS